MVFTVEGTVASGTPTSNIWKWLRKRGYTEHMVRFRLFWIFEVINVIRNFKFIFETLTVKRFGDDSSVFCFVYRLPKPVADMPVFACKCISHWGRQFIHVLYLECNGMWSVRRCAVGWRAAGAGPAACCGWGPRRSCCTGLRCCYWIKLNVPCKV